MFEKIGRAAEKAATNVGVSRRGFFGRFARLAGGAALGAAALLTFSPRTNAFGRHLCKCLEPYYGCNPKDRGCLITCGQCCPGC
jgi:hypothetical protein